MSETLDLMRLDKDELIDLQKRVDKALNAYDARKKAEAKAAAEAVAKEMGFKLSDLIGDTGHTDPKGKKTVLPPKFQNPDDPTQQWTGRGRKPNWFLEKIDAGVPEEQMLIA